MRSPANWWPLLVGATLTLAFAETSQANNDNDNHHQHHLELQVGDQNQSSISNEAKMMVNNNLSTKLESVTQQNLPLLSGEEVNMKLPLYMRIIATFACLIIFTVGVCGNLLVPLVVIKTKYLRNSTNLFLINLSIADLLVLIVCMPTVLIELHSRPETWLLGEPMCKLSNYIEMLAANGSIFTILAISFERYYAICKPLKAGYKCTRLRATIIICIIWLLTSILTSPILIMAKSSETIYIDGSLVYNCILETDTYWTKMYVFVSMFAFFCLPLIVLMLVYWLISRRLIRENLAMSSTMTSLAAKDSIETNHHNHNHDHKHNQSRRRFRNHHQLSSASSSSAAPKSMANFASGRKTSLTAFFASLRTHRSCQYNDHSNGNEQKGENYYRNVSSGEVGGESKAAILITTNGHQSVATTAGRGKKILAGKALSLDHHLIMANCERRQPIELEPTSMNDFDEHSSNRGLMNLRYPDYIRGSQLESEVDSEQIESDEIVQPNSIRFSLIKRYFSQLFNAKQTRGNNSDNSIDNRPKVANNLAANLEQRNKDSERKGNPEHISNGFNATHSTSDNSNGCCSQATVSEVSADDLGSQVPFLPSESNLFKDKSGGGPNLVLTGPTATERRQLKSKKRNKWPAERSKFKWAKRFSISSSIESTQTNCTNLPSESSLVSSQCNSILQQLPTSSLSSGQWPKPIIRCSSGSSNRYTPEGHRASRKKSAHFSLASKTNSSGRTRVLRSSVSGASSSVSPSSTKSPSPDSLFEQEELQLQQEEETQSGQSTTMLERLAQDSREDQMETANISMTSTNDRARGSTGPRGSTQDGQVHPLMVDSGQVKAASFASDGLWETEDLMAHETAAESLASEFNGERNNCDYDLTSPESSRTTTLKSTKTLSTNQLEDETSKSSMADNISQKSASKARVSLDSSMMAGQSFVKPQMESQDLHLQPQQSHSHHLSYNFHFNLRRYTTRRRRSQPAVCRHFQAPNGATQLTELLVVQDLSKKQQMDSRRQVVLMLAFVVACFFLLFFPYRVFTIWLILSTEDQVQSLGMETYYNLTYFSRILIYLHSAINPIAYNLISTKFRRAFMSILLCRGSSSRRHFVTEHWRTAGNKTMDISERTKTLQQSRQQLTR